MITTAKEGGLYAYSLSGAQLQHLPAQPPPGPGHEPGRLNNVDLVHGFRLSTGAKVDLAVASDRGRDQLRVFAIDPAAAAAGRPPLTDVTDPAVPFVFNGSQEEVDEARTAYGLAVSGTRVVVSRRHQTRLGLLQLAAAPGGKVTYRNVRTLDLPAAFPSPTAPPGRRAASPANCRRSKAWWSTAPAACCTRRRRTSASGACAPT
ncbi:phytase [Nonomuraea antimicrobica]